MPLPILHRIPLLIIISLGVIFYISSNSGFRLDIATVPSRVHQPSSNDILPNSSRILIVSAFFPLKVSKHPMDDYAWWLSNFLGSIATDVYFYTSPEMEATVRSVRGELPITINTTFASPFEIPSLAGLRGRYAAMHAQDRERHIHNPNLYAVWNAKPYFLAEAVRHAGQQWDYAFWNDAGSFRSEHRYAQWPDAERINELWEEGSVLTGERKEDLLFIPLTGAPHSSFQYWQENMGPVDIDFSEGSFFGGSPSTVSWWSTVFYAYHDYYLSQDMFVGKDQTLINALFLLFPSRIISVWYNDHDAAAHKGLLYPFDQGALGNCGSDWYYYQFFLANESERGKMRLVWESSARWQWGWWKARQVCRLTELLTMKDLLKRQFGNDWRPPTRNVHIAGEVD